MKWGLVLIIQMWAWDAEANSLQVARELLADSKYQGAAAAYRSIGPSDPAWPEKLEDSMRWFLKNNKPASAWRIAQLALRTQIEIPRLSYYEKLAALKGGACPLGSRVDPHGFELLVQAYASRYYQKYEASSANAKDFNIAADRGLQLSTLADFEVPFLRDLKHTQLISKMGCRFDRPSYKSLQEAEEGELNLLRRYVVWSESHHDEKLPNDLSIKIRILELAQKLRYKDLAQGILEMFSKMTEKDWAQLQDPDRRFLWAALQAEGLIPAGKAVKDSQEEKNLKAILFTSDASHAAAWLGLVEFDQWSVKERQELFQYLDPMTELPFHEDIIVRRALLAYETGQHQKSLEYIQRILAVAEVSENARTGALTIVESLLSEYQYNDAMLGVIQSALPVVYWPRVYRGLLIDHSLRGNLKTYQSIKAQLFQKNRSSGLARLSPELLLIFDALAARHTSDFTKRIELLHKHRSHDFMGLATEVATRSESLTALEYAKLEELMRLLARLLRTELDTGKNQNQIASLLLSLERVGEDQRSKAEKALAGGVSHGGAINIRPIMTLVNPFVWPAAPTMARRNLIAVPKDVVGRSWILE